MGAVGGFAGNQNPQPAKAFWFGYGFGARGPSALTKENTFADVGRNHATVPQQYLIAAARPT